MRHVARPRSPRSLVALLVAGVAAVLLGGCVQIKAGVVSQPGKVGAVKVEHTVCVILDASVSGCPTDNSSGMGEGALQMLAAYRVPSWAPAPTAPTFTATTGPSLTFTRSPSYEAQLQSLLPTPGTRWYGYVSAPSPAIPAETLLQGPLTTSFDLPDDQTASFSHFTVTGWRLQGTIPGGTSDAGSADRPVVCGLEFPPSAGNETKSACNTGWWPNGGAADTDPSDNDQEVFPRNRLTLSGPGAPTEIVAGGSASIPFSANGSVAFLPVTVPLAATTTAPGATATSSAADLSIAGVHEVPVTVNVPPGTAPGDYVAKLTAGGSAGSRSAQAPIRVVAPPTTGTPGGSAATPATPGTPAPTSPTGAGSTPPPPAPDLSTFGGSVAAAVSTLTASTARAELLAGKLRIKVRASSRGYVDASLKRGKTLLAKGQVAAKRKGLVTVKLKLRPAGKAALKGKSAVRGTLTVRFKPRGKKANTTSVQLTVPATP